MTSSPGGGVKRAATAVLLLVSLAGCHLGQVQAGSSEEDKSVSKGKGRRMWRRMVEESCCALTPPPCNHLAMGWADPLDSFPHHYNQFLSCLCKVQKKNSVCEVERLGAILFPDDASSQSVLVEWPERVKNFECGRAANSSLRCRFLTSLGNSPQLQARLTSIRASRASEPLVPCSLLCTKFQCAIDSGIAADVHAAARYYSTCVADKLPLTGGTQTTSTAIDGSSFPSGTQHSQASTTIGVASLPKQTLGEDDGQDDSTTPATTGDLERSRDEGQLSTDKVIIAVLGALLGAVVVAVVIFASFWNCRKHKARPRREVRLVCASDSCTALTPPGLPPSLHPDPHLYADISLPTYANDDTLAAGMKPLPGERPPPYSAQPPYDNNARPPCPCPAPKAALDAAYSSPYDIDTQLGGRGEGEGDDRPAYEIPSAPSTPATPRLTNYSSTPLLRSQGSPSPGSRSHGPRPLTPKPATPRKPAALKALVAGGKVGGARGCSRPHAPPRRRRHSKGTVVTSRRASFERAASVFENRACVVTLTSLSQASGPTGSESPNPEYLEILPDTGALYQVARNIEDQGESSV